MAQEKLPYKLRVLNCNKESTFNAGDGTDRRVDVEEGTLEIKCSTTEIPRIDQSVNVGNYQTPVLGLKEGTGKFQALYLPYATQLDASAIVTATNIPRNLATLEAVLGGINCAAGSTAQTGSTSTSVIADTGHGARFIPNTCIGVVISGVVEITSIVSISTDTLSVWPALSGAPANGATILNTFALWISQTNSKSFSMEVAHPQTTTAQIKLNGCIAKEFSIRSELNNTIAIMHDVIAGDHSVGTLSLTKTFLANDQGNPFVSKSAEIYIQPVGTTTRTKQTVISWELSGKTGMQHIIESGGSGTNGKTGAIRIPENPFVRIKIRKLYDSSDDTDYAGQADVRILIANSNGSGTSKRFCWHLIPVAVRVGQPNIIDNGDGVSVIDQEYAGKIDNTQSTDSGLAPYITGVL